METSPVPLKGCKCWPMLGTHGHILSVPHLQWHERSVYNGHLRWPSTFPSIAERLAVALSLPIFRLRFVAPGETPLYSSQSEVCITNIVKDILHDLFYKPFNSFMSFLFYQVLLHTETQWQLELQPLFHRRGKAKPSHIIILCVLMTIEGIIKKFVDSLHEIIIPSGTSWTLWKYLKHFVKFYYK